MAGHLGNGAYRNRHWNGGLEAVFPDPAWRLRVGGVARSPHHAHALSEDGGWRRNMEGGLPIVGAHHARHRVRDGNRGVGGWWWLHATDQQRRRNLEPRGLGRECEPHPIPPP